MNEDEESISTVPIQSKGERISAEEAESLLLEKLEKAGPNDETVIQELAFFYSLTGREQTAIKYYQRLISNTSDPEKLAGYYIKMGETMIKPKKFDSAIYFYLKAFSLAPKNIKNWCLINNNLGYCLNQVGRFKEAEGYCQCAIKIDSGCYYAYKNLGISLAGLGRYEEAAENLILATQLEPTDLRSLRLLGNLVVEHPEIDSKTQGLDNIVSDNETILQELAYFYGRIGREEKALKYLERLVANSDDPEKRAEYFLKMGANMEGLKNYDAAIFYYSQGFSLEPENTITWYLINNNLGYCLNQFDRFTESESYCRSAIKIDPERHNAYKNLGISLVGQGQNAQAALNYLKATLIEARDLRAFKLLEQLFDNHPEIADEIPDIEAQIQKCKDVVNFISGFQIYNRDSN